MELTADNKLRNLIIVGDRVLIRPKKQAEKTATGLYLPPGVQEREKVQSGYIIKVGPGYPIPIPIEDSEPWKDNEEKIKYIPLQVEEGDLAIFLQREAIEIRYGNEKLFIVPQSSILMLERDEIL
ncbi:co-chaperone GroES [Roseivirga echinicomitans]|uniref:Chaperonin n=1 Tax=Roseivirga echinicomitans TaxID=296218 RepID=A0A150XJY8_9BACT|nr:co-chaperone GroES family protein [Roseivirga echinicomitans]KYG78991.1 chaperonin [Roseivirga echinicomitans]